MEKDPLKTRIHETNYIENPYYLEGTKPAGAPLLAVENVFRQGRTILEQMFGAVTTSYMTAQGKESKFQEKSRSRPPDCLGLKLSNVAVKEAERIREDEQGGRVDASAVSRGLYDVGCLMLDTLFDERPIQRFWFLETVARIPYFSYVSMLHLYESLGWWRGSELRKVHTAEEWNELHHLLIMEALGGNALWSDRFFGYHAALLYYWLLNAVFLFSPRVAYQFMELLEAHAVDTYATFLKENKARLQELPPPAVAVSYYSSADLYMFDDFQVSRRPGSRRPPCDTLYDVFENICADEAEHVKTMQACQDYALVGTMVVSPHATGVVTQSSNATAAPAVDPSVEEEEKRKLWLQWSEQFGVHPLDARADDSGDFA
jgi:ubiquinol oxidase